MKNYAELFDVIVGILEEYSNDGLDLNSPYDRQDIAMSILGMITLTEDMGIEKLVDIIKKIN